MKSEIEPSKLKEVHREHAEPRNGSIPKDDAIFQRIFDWNPLAGGFCAAAFLMLRFLFTETNCRKLPETRVETKGKDEPSKAAEDEPAHAVKPKKNFNWQNALSSLNVIVLFLTLLVLWFTGRETKKLVDDNHLALMRPIILRYGYLDWPKIHFTVKNHKILGSPIELEALKNIAIDVRGFIVLNNLRRPLSLGGDFTAAKKGFLNTSLLIDWVRPHAPGEHPVTLWAVFIPTDPGLPALGENRIVILYKDIEGHDYFTVDSESFGQRVGEGLPPNN